MARPHTLRVGICSCTARYHTHLKKKTLSLPATSSRKTPLVFSIREITIPEDDQRRTLAHSRCHAFIDLHKDDNEDDRWETSVALYDLLRNRPGRRDRLCVGGRGYLDWARSYFWARPLTAAEVLRTLRLLLCRVEERGNLSHWLARMTPEGWDPRHSRRWRRQSATCRRHR